MGAIPNSMKNLFQLIQSHRKRITLWLLIGIFAITGGFNAWCFMHSLEMGVLYLLPYFGVNLAACIYCVARTFEEMGK